MTANVAIIIVAIVFLIALSAFFNGSETALTAASRARMHALEQEMRKVLPAAVDLQPRPLSAARA